MGKEKQKLGLKLEPKKYLEFSQIVEDVLYVGLKDPSFYRQDVYFPYSEEYFTGYPLGVVPEDDKTIQFYRDFYVQGEDKSRQKKLENLKKHDVFIEFDSIPVFKDEIKNHLSKKFKIKKSANDIIDVYLIRYFGVVAYFAYLNMSRKSKLKNGVYSKSNYSKAENSINKLIRELQLGLPLKYPGSRDFLIRELTAINEWNSPDNESIKLYPESNKFSDPVLMMTLSDLILFFVISEGKRAPTFTEVISLVLAESLPKGMMDELQKHVKEYVISRGINQSKIILHRRLGKPEKAISVSKLSGAEREELDLLEPENPYDFPSQESNLLEQAAITEEEISYYKSQV